jgi:hypothetical protein
MRLALSLATSVILLGVLQLPALATSCAEQIGTIERLLDSAGAVQFSGSRGDHIVRTGSPKALHDTPAGAPSDPSLVSTATGIAKARGLMSRAVLEDSQGNQRACENTMSEAKGMIGALP